MNTDLKIALYTRMKKNTDFFCTACDLCIPVT